MDTNIQPLIDWLTQGGTLNSAGAAVGLAVIVRFILVPMAKYLLSFRGIELSSVQTIKAAYVCGVLCAVAVGLATQDSRGISAMIAIGLTSGAIAIGMNETGTQSAKAAAALEDAKQFDTLMKAAILEEEEKTTTQS